MANLNKPHIGGQWRALCLLAIAAGSLGSATLAAEKGLSRTEIAQKRAEVMKILSDDQATIDPVFEEYFKGFFLPQFVAPTVSAFSLDDLPRVRNELKRCFKAGKNTAALDQLNKMVFDKMSAIILKGEGIKPGSPYEGAIKYNALLVMTELTDNDGGKPKPSADAFKFLFHKILKGNTKDYMKAAALIGIERDAAARAIPKDAVPEVTKTLLDLVNQKEPPAGRDAAAHQYLRRSAAQVLAAMGSPGPDYSVAKTFESLAADPKLRPTFRCEMAQFIGQLKFPKAAEAEVQRLATCVARQTLSICRQELDNAKAGNRARRARCSSMRLAHRPRRPGRLAAIGQGYTDL